jgi:hypothetical protein
VAVPDTLDFITGLLIAVDAVVDTIPPIGPAHLVLTDTIPGTSATLDWSAWLCEEEQFAYYEILFDTLYFEDTAAFVWDWTEDSSLLDRLTGQTIVSLPGPAAGYCFRIRGWDEFGNAGPLSQICGYNVTAVDQNPEVPRLVLAQNTPNPFNPSTTISFQLTTSERICLAIYDLRGRQVRLLAESVCQPGWHTLHWDGKNDRGGDLPSGTYLYRLAGGDDAVSRKMLLLR